MTNTNNSQNISISNSRKVSLGDIKHTVSCANKSQSCLIDQEMLNSLFQDLNNELRKLPADREQDADAIATIANELSEKSSKKSPNPKLVRISAEGLVDAANAVGDLAPKILDISGKIARLVSVLL
jgi:hypothetical protein